MRVPFLSMLLILAVSFVFVISPASADYITLTGTTFGTSYMVKVIDEDPIEIERLESAIRIRLEQIDQRMSTYREDSEVSRFNHTAPGEWFPVSEETARLVQRATELSQMTSGAFDVTVGPVVTLWNFGAGTAEHRFQVPSDELIASTRDRVGYENLAVQLDPPALKKSVDGLEVDLSAIAKGYAVDAVAELLHEYPNYMVEIGGEVRTKGSRNLGKGWRIGLEWPTRNERRVDSIITLNDQALATSGDYRSFQVQDGVTYSHTMDPATGRPVKHSMASATVLADDCATADALATALLVMGPERGQAFAVENNICALLVMRNDDQVNSDSKLTHVATSGFPMGQDSPASTNYVGTFLITAVVFGVALLAMSIGTIVANRRLQGTCGGMAGLKDQGGKTICELCTKPSPECTGEPTKG